MILGSGLLTSSWPKASDWLIRDEFTDTRAAGSVNGTAATPGPGPRVVTDTESKLSAGSGALAIAARSVVAGGDPAIWYGAVAREAGNAMIVRMADTSTLNVYCGFSNAQFGYANLAPFFQRNGVANLVVRTSSSTSTDPYSFASLRRLGIVLRSSGALFFVQNDSAEWILLWVDSAVATAPVYPHIHNASPGAVSVDYVRCIALPAPFDIDNGLATDVHSGSVAAGTTFTHEADCIIEATLTTRPTADNADIIFRQQDASNYWICRVNSSGDISLQEVVSGTPTQRSVAAGVVSSGHRVVVIAEGTTIKCYSNNTLRWTYSSATNFATATAGKLNSLGTGGAVSDLISWPRTLSGTAASILNKVSA